MAEAVLREVRSQGVDVEVALIQGLIPLGLKAVEDRLQQEVESLAGKKQTHGKENVRWGRQAGSVYLRDQKVPVMHPRVRNKATATEVPLAAYQEMQEPYRGDRQTMLRLLQGISTHKYGQSMELVPEVFGISPSNLSRRFKKNTIAQLRQLKTRSLKGYNFVCVIIDGKRYAEDGLLVALGVTLDGTKVILDIDQSHSENSGVVRQLFDRLIERGLRFEEGLLFIVDGSKGIISAVERRFEEYAFIQRCQWHKQQNVIGYLNDAQKEICKRALQAAYAQTTYREAKAGLEKLHRELQSVNESAANSLMEGLEETLTLHRLGLSPELCKSLNTTNCMESVMAQLGQYTDKVDRWHNSNQILRWTAAGLLEIEPRLHKIRGYRYLHLLRIKMRDEIKKRQEKQAVGCATIDDPVTGRHLSTPEV
jgi:transposase-like protein